MPIKNSFRRSLLNCQPQAKTSSRVISTAYDQEDGYTGVHAGFTSIIERQVGLEPRTEDSISLSGIFDSAGSDRFSTDPQRPEIIAISQLFQENPFLYQKLLSLKSLEASLDEADLKTIFDLIYSRPLLKQALEERLNEYFENRKNTNNILSTLAQIVSSVDGFRDSINFIESNATLHRTAAKKRERINTKFSEDPKGSSMSLKRTFLGLDDVTVLSNTSLLQLLLISLALPGNVSFKPSTLMSEQASRFFLPIVEHDVASDFLQLLATKDIRNKSDFFDIESSLPKDASARLSILADALSYELTTTIGLKKAGIDTIFDLLNSKIAPVTNIIREEPVETSISSLLRNETTLPFEVRTHTIDGVSYKGVLEEYVDPYISNSSLDFSNLSTFSRDFSSKVGSYLNQIKKIRCIEDGDQKLTSSGLLSWICEYIAKSTDRYRELQKPGQVITAPNELVQLSLFCEIAKNNTAHGIGARFNIFSKIFEEIEGEKKNSTASQIARPSILKPFKSREIDVKSNYTKNLQTIDPKGINYEQKGPYAVGGFYSSKSGKTSEEKNREIFKNLDTDEQKVGVSKASLELLDISINDILNNRNNHFQSRVRNPIIKVANSKSSARSNEKTDQNTNNEITRSKAISHITFGSYAIDPRVLKNRNASKMQNPINATRTFLRASKNLNPINIRRMSKKIENNSSKSSKITSTFITPNIKKIEIDLQSSRILGTSLMKDGVIEHSNISYGGLGSNSQHSISRNVYVSNPSEVNENGIIEELVNLISSIRLNDASKRTNKNSNLKNSNLNLESSNKRAGSRNMSVYDGTNIQEKYFDIFNSLVDGTNDVVRGALTPSTLEQIIDKLNTGISISHYMKEFYIDLMSTIREELKISNSENNVTSNYFLNSDKIKFIIYQIFNSILSLFNSSRLVKVRDRNSESTYILTVQSRIDVSELMSERRALQTIASSNGTVADIISSATNISKFSDLLKAISYCSTSNDLLIERYSLSKAYVESYTNSVAALTNAVSNKETKKIINALNVNGKLEILDNLTQEYISLKQLSLIKDFENPITVRYPTRISRIANNIISLLLKSPNISDFDIVTVGVPVKTTETLRRVDSKGITNLDTKGRGEYIEIEMSKRDLQFSDIIRKSPKIRFTPLLEVIPQFSIKLDMISSFEDFTFLCYYDKKWNQHHFSDAVDFVSNKTSLEYVDAVIVTVNHIIDALCKLAVKSLSGIMLENLTSTKVKNEISKQGYSFFKGILTDQIVGNILPVGDMLENEYLNKIDNNYSLKTFSKLGKNVIDKTDQPTHRLLTSLLNDPIFSYENELDELTSTTAFERVYCCVVSSNDFEIDRKLSYSLESAKTMISGLLHSSLMTDDGDSLYYVKEKGKISRLIADEISVKINLVSN